MGNKSIKLAIMKLGFCLFFVNYLSFFFFNFLSFFCQRAGELKCLIYVIWPKQIILFFFQIFRPFDGPGGGGGQSSPVPQTSGNKSVTRYEEISNKTRPGLNSYNNEWVVVISTEKF